MPDKPTKKVIKKVSAYPFPVALKFASGAVTGQLVKLTPQGFLAETPATNLQPGDRFEFSFEVPVHHQSVTANGVCIKIYSTWSGRTEAGGAESDSGASGAAPAMVNLVEVHFQSISDPHREVVRRFLLALARVEKG